MTLDPATGLTLVKIVAEASKKLHELIKTVKDREIKQKLDEVLDEFRDLKHKASELEDENRELHEKLRFKSDEFEFRNPFYFEKIHPDRPLCPKCFAKEIAAPMAEPYRSSGRVYRRCLVCEAAITQERGAGEQLNPAVRVGPWS